MNKCVFLDRDGVINLERGDYTYKLEDFEILPGVVESIIRLKSAGFFIVVITNQAGIMKGVYTRQQMNECHKKLQIACSNNIDSIYYCPYHPSITESLARKPDTLMFEKAISKYRIDPQKSWMVGDRERDIIPAHKLGMRTALVTNDKTESIADYQTSDLAQATEIILGEGQ